MAEGAVNLLGLDPSALADFFEARGERRFRATQILKWIYQRRALDFDEMTDLSKSLRASLHEHASLQLPKLVREQRASDGVRKWLFQLADGNAIETVFIPDGERRTLCVSSQVGCTLTCSFCATGRQGFNRNLSADEIIAQVLIASIQLADEYPERPVSNVVMMGMGEPLYNFDNVVSAMRLMLDDNAFGLSRRRVTLSTAGYVPMIDRLSETLPVALAVSLHAADDELRNELVPINRKYPLDQLMAACHRYIENDSRGRITFEYTMMANVNDQLSHARQLVDLVRDLPCKINLIPYNPVPGIAYERSSNNQIHRFADYLHGEGLVAPIRKTRGDDIDAACGQLAGDFVDRTKRRERNAVSSRVHVELQGLSV